MQANFCFVFREGLNLAGVAMEAWISLCASVRSSFRVWKRAMTQTLGRIPNSGLQYCYGADHRTLRWIFCLDPPRRLETRLLQAIAAFLVGRYLEAHGT